MADSPKTEQRPEGDGTPPRAGGIADQGSLERWLETRSADEARAIALRAALRVFPLTFQIFKLDEKRLSREKREALVLQSFRALLIARAFIDNPADRSKIGIAADAAARAAARAAAAADAADAIWTSINDDAGWLEGEGGSDGAARRLLNRPLWDVDGRAAKTADGTAVRAAPDWALKELDEFSNGPGAARPWSLIAEWCEAAVSVVDGQSGRAFSPRAELDIATQPDEFWKGGDATAVLEKLAAIVGERAGSDTQAPDTDGYRTLSDEPTADDRLGRELFAQTLVERMDDVMAFGGRDGFCVHLHAPWGAGKTSVLMQMMKIMRRRHREDGKWAVVEFNAWQYERMDPPWWPFLESVKKGCMRSARRSFRPDRWLWLGILRVFWWVEAHFLPIALALAATLLAILLLWLASDAAKPEDGLLAQLASVLPVLGEDVLASVGTLFATFVATYALTQSMIFGSKAKADHFTSLTSDPMKRLKKMFRRTVEGAGMNVCIFVDDLDRCDVVNVVEFLQGLQTLFRHRNVAYVVAADRVWLRASYEKAYKDFNGLVGSAETPLGYLFLEKVFQISTAIPGMGRHKNSYVDGLLSRQAPADAAETPAPTAWDGMSWDERYIFVLERLRQSPLVNFLLPDYVWRAEGLFRDYVYRRAVEKERTRIKEDYKGGITSAAANARLSRADLSQAARDATILEMNSSKAATSASESLLMEFFDELPENPRVLKRIVNAFGMRRNFALLDFNDQDPGKRSLSWETYERVLARWTILEQRFPAATDLLRRDPSLTGRLGDAVGEDGDEDLKSFSGCAGIKTMIGDADWDADALTEPLVREITRGSRV